MVHWTPLFSLRISHERLLLFRPSSLVDLLAETVELAVCLGLGFVAPDRAGVAAFNLAESG